VRTKSGRTQPQASDCRQKCTSGRGSRGRRAGTGAGRPPGHRGSTRDCGGERPNPPRCIATSAIHASASAPELPLRADEANHTTNRQNQRQAALRRSGGGRAVRAGIGEGACRMRARARVSGPAGRVWGDGHGCAGGCQSTLKRPRASARPRQWHDGCRHERVSAAAPGRDGRGAGQSVAGQGQLIGQSGNGAVRPGRSRRAAADRSSSRPTSVAERRHGVWRLRRRVPPSSAQVAGGRSKAMWATRARRLRGAGAHGCLVNCVDGVEGGQLCRGCEASGSEWPRMGCRRRPPRSA